MLTERRQKLLQFIIDEYVSTAQPVGSNALVEKYALPVSSATIRNEMAHLEDEGYIAQPHTSAGRVPTDHGYRYYVEALMREEQVPAELQQTIRHQFHQAARELEEWARLAAAIMAARLDNAAVVTTPHSPQPTRALARARRRARLPGAPRRRPPGGPRPAANAGTRTTVLAGRADLVARRLNDLLAGKTAAEIRARALEASPVEAAVFDSTATLLRASRRRRRAGVSRRAA